MSPLPKSVNKILSRLQSPARAHTVPVYQKNNSNITLFDELPEAEKQAAIIKLEQLASEQPGSTTPNRKKTRSCFNWKTFAMVFLGLGFVTFAVVASVALAIDVDKDPDLVAKLRMANTNLDRMDLLPDNSDWVFDFTKQDKYTFSPGGVVNANAATFPATVGQGMTMAMLNLGPCSMLPPHLHPRATNYVVAISGTTMTYMIAENGARTVTETLNAGQMTIFPQASIHTMMNIGCENAQLISALNSDDTGTTNLANAFFSLPQNITGTVIGGGLNVATIDGRLPDIGTGSNYGPEACIAACAAKGKMIKRSF
ncbi:RmlC-like cupin domain-containing protein [Exophiala viscosa]|uniref:RmlC-like cupin domain-containing protein n=1 Tax=Exophiala viscosa TaxID=2486360 RepID=A0AAN6IAE3_9EURO|nr:RmlC-like cupin domain-containing protein [Exophiala viscosa]